MEKYFIIKAGRFYMCFIKDTMENLEKFLSSEKITIIGEEETDVQDMRLVFRKLIKTEFDTMGESPELEEEINEKLKHLFLESGDEKLISLYNTMTEDVEKITSAFSCYVPIKGHCITILVSDGETRDKPGYYYGSRTFCKFSDINPHEFWRFSRRFGGQARIGIF